MQNSIRRPKVALNSALYQKKKVNIGALVVAITVGSITITRNLVLGIVYFVQLRVLQNNLRC